MHCSAWFKRPLPASAVKYAAQDVRYLLVRLDVVRKELVTVKMADHGRRSAILQHLTCSM
jgi:ribonuclease D